MKNQKNEYKLIDNSGRVLIPFNYRKMLNLESNSVVRVDCYKNILLIEKVEIEDEDLVEKLRTSFIEEEDECSIFKIFEKGSEEKLKKLIHAILTSN